MSFYIDTTTPSEYRLRFRDDMKGQPNMKTNGICYGIWRSNCAHDASEYWEEIQGNSRQSRRQRNGDS